MAEAGSSVELLSLAFFLLGGVPEVFCYVLNIAS
jgi:hypothetical protein